MSLISNKYGWRATSNQVKEHFGLREHEPWPDEGMDPIQVNGVTLYVEPLRTRDERKFLWNGHKCYRNPHRLRAICPVCGRPMSYGRIDQHMKVHGRK